MMFDASHREPLTTARLSLEPLVPKHADEMIEVLADPGLYEFLALDPPASVESLRERFERLSRGFNEPGDEIWLNWIVRDRESDVAIGYVQATVYEDMACELSVLIARELWNRGFATEACRAVLPTLWLEFGVERLEATVDNRNLAAAVVAERLGFAYYDATDGQDYHTGQPTQEVLLVCDRPSAHSQYVGPRTARQAP